MLSVGVKEIAMGVGIAVRTAQLWTTRPDWPTPSSLTVNGTGRPEARWSVTDLPVSITIKGKAVLVRERVKAALVNQLLTPGEDHVRTPIALEYEKTKASVTNRKRTSSQQPGSAGPAYPVRRQDATRPAAVAPSNADGLCGAATGTQVQQCADALRGAVLIPRSAPVSLVLKDWQKSTAEARAGLLHEVERIAAVIGREKAITKVVIMAADGTLPEHLAQLVPVANARAGKSGKRTLSRRTIYSWLSDFNAPLAQGGRANQAVNALAPKDAHAVAKVPLWANVVLNLYQQPQGVSLAWVCREMVPVLEAKAMAVPSYHQVRRFLSNMGAVELQAGRMGSRQIKNIKPFVRRDTSMLWPGEVYTADGHCFDAEVAHPTHARPFRPEITSVLDVNTRRCVGWSVDLAESGLAVLDALRNACETGGIPSIFYVDNGSGYRNALMSASGTGLMSRLGTTMMHSLPYNSQARGIIERSHQTIWVAAAKELPTYIGATMDAQAKQVVHKLTRKDVKAAGKSKYLMGFQEFIQFCEIKVAAYNARPHRSLPKIRDAASGKKRHMSPDEAWAVGIAEGAELELVQDGEAQDLFHPQKEAGVKRGEVRLFGTWYYSKSLEQHHNEAVRVGYDVRNAAQVWIYDQQGRFICTAGLRANEQAYFPPSVLEKAKIIRAKGRLRCIDAKRDEVLAELAGSAPKDITAPALELAPSPVLNPILKFTGLELVEADLRLPELEAALQETTAPAKRPMFDVESEHYEWLMQHKNAWLLNDARFLQRYLSEEDGYALLKERFELLEMEWKEEDQHALNAFFVAADQAERSA